MSTDDNSLPQAILQALIPDAGQRASVTNSQQPPSNFNNAFTSQDAFETALEAMSNSSDPNVAALPEQWRRIFHPKGTAYGHHSDKNLNAVLAGRRVKSAATSSPPPPPPPPSSTPAVAPPPSAPTASDICGDWYKSVLDYFEIRGKDFDPAKFGTDGSGLRDQIKHCGALTKWSFSYTPTIRGLRGSHMGSCRLGRRLVWGGRSFRRVGSCRMGVRVRGKLLKEPTDCLRNFASSSGLSIVCSPYLFEESMVMFFFWIFARKDLSHRHSIIY